MSQERQASESHACKEFVERVAGRIRHSRMQGREERGDDEDLDVVEDDDDGYMADMKYGILAARYKGRLKKSTAEEVKLSWKDFTSLWFAAVGCATWSDTNFLKEKLFCRHQHWNHN